jgi:hypothetical protein
MGKGGGAWVIVVRSGYVHVHVYEYVHVFFVGDWRGEKCFFEFSQDAAWAIVTAS